MKTHTMRSHILLTMALIAAMVVYGFVGLMLDGRLRLAEAAVPTTVPTGVSGPVSGDSVSMYNGGTFVAGIGIAPASAENALTIVPYNNTTYGLDVQNAAGTSVFQVRGTGGAITPVGAATIVDDGAIPSALPAYQLTAALDVGTASIVTTTATIGQRLLLIGPTANSVTITETALSCALGAATRALGPNDVMELVFTGVLWAEHSFIAN